MSIKLAFSTVATPDWTLEQVAAQAKVMGYDGVELRTLGAGSGQLACDPVHSDPRKVKFLFREAGIELVCLSTSVSLHSRAVGEGHRDSALTVEAMQWAAELGCAFVRVFVNRIDPGESRQSVMGRVAERLGPLAEKAADLNVQLLLENSGSFATAKPWWWLLNLIDSPMLGLSWNLANAAAAGEGPAVSLPMLNSRIRLVKVKDAQIGEGSGFVPLGEGSVEIEHSVRRLLGIGYAGYLSVEWDRLWLPSLTPAQEYLPDAARRLRGWLNAIAQSIEDAKPKPKGAKAKAAAH